MPVCYEHAHFSDDDDERAVQVGLKMKEMSALLSGFITLNSGVFYTLLCVTFLPPFQPFHSAVRSRSPWLNEVIFAQRWDRDDAQRALMGKLRQIG